MSGKRRPRLPLLPEPDFIEWHGDGEEQFFSACSLNRHRKNYARPAVDALRDCVEALRYLQSRTATRINPPTLENAEAVLALYEKA